MVRKEKKCNKNKNLEKMHWSAADPTFQEATDYVMHFLMRQQQQQHIVSKSPKMSLCEFWLLNETFWSDFQTLILHWIWFMLAMTNCDGRRKILNVVLGMWGECFIYFFLTFQWRPWRIMWRLWNGCKTVGWWLLLHLERTMESSKPLIQFCGWTTCKQTTLVFTNALSLLTVDVKFSHLENWGWEVLLFTHVTSLKITKKSLVFQFGDFIGIFAKYRLESLVTFLRINSNKRQFWVIFQDCDTESIYCIFKPIYFLSPFSSPDILPTLSYSFIDQTVQPGPLVSLKCSASGNPTPRISWTLDGYNLPQKDR